MKIIDLGLGFGRTYWSDDNELQSYTLKNIDRDFWTVFVQKEGDLIGSVGPFFTETFANQYAKRTVHEYERGDPSGGIAMMEKLNAHE